ncbi:MAG: DHH family phosphoesterase, partial [Spirochaetaceae bacterium]|nr:DHH family phosphoesterase [Spirochaetaceae bacterium]
MTLENATERLRLRDNFIVVSHDGPDADGLGAAYALVLALASIGKRAIAVVATKPSRKYAFIDRSKLFVSLDESKTLPFEISKATLVILDTHDTGYLGSRIAELLDASACKIILDHHELTTEPGADEFVDPLASSSCELVYLV